MFKQFFTEIASLLAWIRQDPRQALNPIAEQRYREHSAGWTVIKNGQSLAELHFSTIDPPFYCFHLRPIGGGAIVRRLLLHSALRDPDPELKFRCRNGSALTVKDGSFLASLQADGTVKLRDFRPVRAN